MSIGIWDMDMSTYILVPFNLEAMKLSSYYKKKNEIVVLAPSFTPERHQKFFVRKDYDDGNFPNGLSHHKNVEYGGHAFSGKQYIQLPEEIEICKPDTSLYSRMEQAFKIKGDNKNIFKNMMEGEHGRISLDGKTIWPDYMKQFGFLPSARTLILHDYNLGAIENSFEEVQKLLSNARTDGWSTRIGVKFPIQVSTGKELLNWSSLKTHSVFYSIQFNGICDFDSWIEYVQRLYKRSSYYNLEYYITNGNLTEKEFCQSGLRQILRQVIFARSNRVHFLLKFTDGFFSDHMWEKVIKLFQFYLNSYLGSNAAKYFSSLPTDTLFDFAKHTQEEPYHFYNEALTKSEIREIFSFVRENNPQLFKDFYECNLISVEEEFNV